jgi:hypothetical protein
MSIGENWLAPQPTANIANAIVTQAPGPLRMAVVVAMRSTLTPKLSNLHLTVLELADALEVLILLAPAQKAGSLGEATRAKSLRWARMCYDHLAGAVGVSVTEALIGRGLLVERDGSFHMAPDGAAEFGRFGIEVNRLERRTRPLLRPCLDWSERRYHLAGSLGAALTSALLTRRWITTREASRIVTVTKAGEAGLREWVGVDLDELRAAA